jgi:hypothetical protein
LSDARGEDAQGEHVVYADVLPERTSGTLQVWPLPQLPGTLGSQTALAIGQVGSHLMLEL